MIKDSGSRREFGTGAVRDIAEGKGRMDLIPLDLVASFVNTESDILLTSLEMYQRSNEPDYLKDAIWAAADSLFLNIYDAIFEYSKHMEEGCNKYGDRNWEKGIPTHCYIDSAARHYIKCLRGDDDERHDRAVLWNLFGALWNHTNKPELVDIPYVPYIALADDESEMTK